MGLIPNDDTNIWITSGCGFSWDWCDWANVGYQGVDGLGGTRVFNLHIDWWDQMMPPMDDVSYDILMAYSLTPFDGSESYSVYASTGNFSAYMDCETFSVTGYYRFKIATSGPDYIEMNDPGSILEMQIYNGVAPPPPIPPIGPGCPGCI